MHSSTRPVTIIYCVCAEIFLGHDFSKLPLSLVAFGFNVQVSQLRQWPTRVARIVSRLHCVDRLDQPSSQAAVCALRRSLQLFCQVQ